MIIKRDKMGRIAKTTGLLSTTCIVCGKKKWRYYSQKEYKYCSQECYHISKKGRKRPEHSAFLKELFKQKGSWRRGKTLSKEQIEKVSGERSHAWKGGVTPLYHKIKRLSLYNQWRLRVYERDLFTCQQCKKSGLRLECHHITGFAKMLKDYNIKTAEDAINCSALWDINNGTTLCKECHKKTDTYGRNNV